MDIYPAAGNLSTTATGDIPPVTGITAVTLFVRQPEINGNKYTNSSGHRMSSFHTIYTAVDGDKYGSGAMLQRAQIFTEFTDASMPSQTILA